MFQNLRSFNAITALTGASTSHTPSWGQGWRADNDRYLLMISWCSFLWLDILKRWIKVSKSSVIRTRIQEDADRITPSSVALRLFWNWPVESTLRKNSHPLSSTRQCVSAICLQPTHLPSLICINKPQPSTPQPPDLPALDYLMKYLFNEGSLFIPLTSRQSTMDQVFFCKHTWLDVCSLFFTLRLQRLLLQVGRWNEADCLVTHSPHL